MALPVQERLFKAVAGEAGFTFISNLGSEFVEMYVLGVGASRVMTFLVKPRRMPHHASSLSMRLMLMLYVGNVVLDMLKAMKREQTVNFVGMDGFEDGNPGVITIVVTNRVDILDQALLRPGRFDRKVTVDLPDLKGRTRILGVHSCGKPLKPDVDLEAISRRTSGYSGGAQLENLMNEAAIGAAARKAKNTIG
jgi:cell division protease FtsH